MGIVGSRNCIGSLRRRKTRRIEPLLAIVLGACLLSSDTNLQPPPIEEYVSVPIAEAHEFDLSTTSVKEYAIKVATEHSLNVKQFTDTIECESGFTWNAYNKSEDSAGAVQIHLPAHKDITLEQANNPEWAIPWMAEQWEKGNQHIWSCYR